MSAKLICAASRLTVRTVVRTVGSKLGGWALAVRVETPKNLDVMVKTR
jgi:hypothetical protein